jgi:uncharacterized protein (UPF0332 family)
MAAKLSHADLLLISKGDAKTINHFRLGARLFQLSGIDIDQLSEGACRDRFRFAQETLRCARWALVSTKPQYRVALARSYYAMYHAARSVVFIAQGGDDYEAHTELPKHLPKDLPSRDQWENELKTARYERNRADYDPYPKSDTAFRATAEATLRTAETFFPVVKNYLKRKGVSL